MTARDEGYLESSALQDYSWHNIGYDGNLSDSFFHTAHFDGEAEECDSVEDPNLILLYVHKQSDFLPHCDEYGGFRFLETIEEETSDDLRSESGDSGSFGCWGSAENQSSDSTDNQKTLLELVNAKNYSSREENEFNVEDVLPRSHHEAFLQRPRVLKQHWGFLQPRDDIREFSQQYNLEECNDINASRVSECLLLQDEKEEDEVSDSEGSDLSEFSSMECAVLAEFSFEDLENPDNGWNTQSKIEPQKTDFNCCHLFRNKDYSEAKGSANPSDETKPTSYGENNSFSCLSLEPDNNIEVFRTVAHNSEASDVEYSSLIRHQSSGSLADYSINGLNNKDLHKCDGIPLDENCVHNAIHGDKNEDYAPIYNKGCGVDLGNANSNVVCERSYLSSLQHEEPTDDSYVNHTSKTEQQDLSSSPKSLEQCLVLEGEEISAGEDCDWKDQDFPADNFYLESLDGDEFIKQHNYQDHLIIQSSKFRQDGLNKTDYESDPRLVVVGSVNHLCLTNAMEKDFKETCPTGITPSALKRAVCLKELEKRNHDVSSGKKQVSKKELNEAYITNSELINNVENPQQQRVDNDLVKTANILSLQRVKEENDEVNTDDSECIVGSLNCDNNWSALGRACLARVHQGGSFETLVSRTNNVSQLLHVQNSDSIPLESPCKSSLMGHACENVPKNRCAPHSVFQEDLVRQLAKELLNEQTTHASTKKHGEDCESDICKNNTDINMLLNEQTMHASTEKPKKECVSDIYKSNIGIHITGSRIENKNSKSGQSYGKDNFTSKISTSDRHDQSSADEVFAPASPVTMETNNNCDIRSQQVTHPSKTVWDTWSTPESWFHPLTSKLNREGHILQLKLENDTKNTSQSEQRKRKILESAGANTPKRAHGGEWEMIKERHETLRVSKNVKPTYFNTENNHDTNMKEKQMVEHENVLSRAKLECSFKASQDLHSTDCFQRVGKSTVSYFKGVPQQETIDGATKDHHVDSKEIGLGTSVNQTTLTPQKGCEKERKNENGHPLITRDLSETGDQATQQTNDVFAHKGDTLETTLGFNVQQKERDCEDPSLRISDQHFHDQSKHAICNNEYLFELKNREPPEGSEAPNLSIYDDQQQTRHCVDRKCYNTSLYVEYHEQHQSGFDYGETGSAQKDVEGSLNTNGNDINNKASQTLQSHFPRSRDEAHCNSGDIVTNQTQVEFIGERDVAPSLEKTDNYNVILGFLDDSSETRSVQGHQRELYDLNSIENKSESLPRGTCPCWSKSNAAIANVEVNDLQLRAGVKNDINVPLNRERHEGEDLEPSLFEGEPEKYLPAEANIQLKIQLACCRNARYTSTGELRNCCKCEAPPFTITTTAEGVLPHSGPRKQCAIDDGTTRVVTTLAKPLEEIDNSQSSLARVNICFKSLVNDDLPRKSPPTLSTTDTWTEICGVSHPGTAHTVGNGPRNVCLPSLIRSNSEPALHSTSVYQNEHSFGSRLIVQEKGSCVNDLSERGRRTGFEANHATLVCSLQERKSALTTNFDKQTPSEQSQDCPLFSPNMDETRMGVKFGEELEQEPVSVRRQVLQVHATVIQPCEKSKVRFSGGIPKPDPPLKSGHMLTPGREPQEYTSYRAARGPKDKTSGSVSTNFTSSVTSYEGSSLPSNMKKAPVITTWKHGGTRGRPKVVRIVTPNDNVDDKSVVSVCEDSRRENDFSVENQSVTKEMDMEMRLPNRLSCNQTYLVKVPPQSLRVKENIDEILSLYDGYNRSEYPSLVRPPKTSSPVTACDLVSSDLKSSSLRSQENDPYPTRPAKGVVETKAFPCISSDDTQKQQNLPTSSPFCALLFTNPPKPAKEGAADRLERITGYNSATKRNTIKPPLPRQLQNFINVRLNSGIRGRIANKRKQFLEAIQSSDGFEDDDGRQDGELHRFEAFKRSIEAERTRLITSTPDLVELERAVRSSRRRIDRTLAFKDPSQQETSAEWISSERRRYAGDVWPGYRQKLTQYKQICREEKTPNRGSRSAAYLETDIDTLESRLVYKINHFKTCRENYTDNVSRARSMLTLADQVPEDQSTTMEDNQRARSMDFLLDDDNRLAALPPENTLNAHRTLSEHELRIERSLQNLNLPDWYKNSPWSKRPQGGIFLKRDEGRRRPRWQGLGSRISSSTSLASASFSRRNLTTSDRIFSTDWRSIGSLQSSRESLTGFSVGSVSPANSYPLSRWSCWRLSATSATVTGWSPYRSFRQPYLGWRAAAGQTSSSSFSGAPSPAPSTPPSNSRSVSPGRILEDSQPTPPKLTDEPQTRASPHRQAEDVEESCLHTVLGAHFDRCDHSPDNTEKGPEEAPPPMYHFTGDTEARNYHNGSNEKGSPSYDFGKTGSPPQYPKIAYDSSPERQLSSSLQKDSPFKSSAPHFYDYSIKSGTSTSSTSSPAMGISYEEYPHRRSSPEKEFSFRSDLSLHPVHRRGFVNKETDHLHSTFLTERKVNGISTAGRVESVPRNLEFGDLEDGVPVRESTFNEGGEWMSEERSDLSLSFMQDFHSWFQSTQEVDIQRDSSSHTQSVHYTDCIPDTTKTREIRQPAVDDVQQSLTDGNQYKHQSQKSPLTQRVMWMESSFMKARPPTTVVVMAAEESHTEGTNGSLHVSRDDDNYPNGSCHVSRDDDSYQEQYGPDGAVSSYRPLQ